MMDGGFGQPSKMPPFGLSNRSRYLGSIDKLGPAVTDGKALYLTVTYTRSPNWHVVRVDPRTGSSAFVRKVPPGCHPLARKIVSGEEARPGGKTEACACFWSDGSKQPHFAPHDWLSSGGSGVLFPDEILSLEFGDSGPERVVEVASMQASDPVRLPEVHLQFLAAGDAHDESEFLHRKIFVGVKPIDGAAGGPAQTIQNAVILAPIPPMVTPVLAGIPAVEPEKPGHQSDEANKAQKDSTKDPHGFGVMIDGTRNQGALSIRFGKKRGGRKPDRPHPNNPLMQCCPARRMTQQPP